MALLLLPPSRLSALAWVHSCTSCICAPLPSLAPLAHLAISTPVAPPLAVVQMHQRLAFATITAMRKSFDIATGYHPDRMNEARWLRRIIFLETTAGVPGMVSNKQCGGSDCVADSQPPLPQCRDLLSIGR